MQSPALFQNTAKFCTVLPGFSNILPFFNISLHFFWKIAPTPLLSRIGPALHLDLCWVMSNSSHENKKAWSPIYQPEGYFPYICTPNVNEPTLTQRFHLQKIWLYRQANTLPLLLYYLQIIEMQEATHLISLTKATVPMLSTENRLCVRGQFWT